MKRTKRVFVAERQSSIFELDDVFKPKNWIEKFMCLEYAISGMTKEVADLSKAKRITSPFRKVNAEWCGDVLVAPSSTAVRAKFLSMNFDFTKPVKAVRIIRTRKTSYCLNQQTLFALDSMSKRVKGAFKRVA